jgi:IclR family transcriptional regulator, KDG regulon repressor
MLASLKWNGIPYYGIQGDSPRVPKISNSTNGNVKSLVRALSLLDVLAQTPHECSLGDIATKAKLPPSTVHRLLHSLQMTGYVIQNQTTGNYALGEALILLGRKAEQQRDVRRTARPSLEKLAQETAETVSLTTVIENAVVQLDHVDSPSMLKVTWDSGRRFPIHASASGKVFLAYLPETEREQILKSIDLHPFTKRTIVDIKKSRTELNGIRERGYAIDDAEREEGVRCVAAPIFNSTGSVIAAVSVSGPSTRVSLSSLEGLANKVMKTACTISAALGHLQQDTPKIRTHK